MKINGIRDCCAIKGSTGAVSPRFAIKQPHRAVLFHAQRPHGFESLSVMQEIKKEPMLCMSSFFIWQGNRDSNPNNTSQSRRCYRYTIPLHCSRNRSGDLVGRGIGIRTPTIRVRVVGATVTQFPYIAPETDRETWLAGE